MQEHLYSLLFSKSWDYSPHCTWTSACGLGNGRVQAVCWAFQVADRPREEAAACSAIGNTGCQMQPGKLWQYAPKDSGDKLSAQSVECRSLGPKQRNSLLTLDSSLGFRKQEFRYIHCEACEVSPKKHVIPLSAVPFTEENSKQLLQFVFFTVCFF